MPPLTIPAPQPRLHIRARRLTPAAFRPYGSVIQNPPDASTSPAPVVANQGTALKHPDVSQLRDHYAVSAPSGAAAQPALSLFVCDARTLRRGEEGKGLFDVRVLERHPYTSQTFVPLGLAPRDDRGRGFLVVVAPEVEGAEGRPPDLRRAEAFTAEGGQAVTYAAGTWHAPMVALGRDGERVEFVVVQFANGVGEEDCQEVFVGEDRDVEEGKGLVVEVDWGEGGKARL